MEVIFLPRVSHYRFGGRYKVEKSKKNRWHIPGKGKKPEKIRRLNARQMKTQ